MAVWLTELERPHPKPLSQGGRGALRTRDFFLLLFSSCGRRGWGMRGKDVLVNRGREFWVSQLLYLNQHCLFGEVREALLNGGMHQRVLVDV